MREYKFSDLFDLNEIQKIQDLFSEATGVSSLITEPDGTPITKPSNFCSLCNNIIRKTEVGLRNCLYSDFIIGKPNKNGPRIQKCLSGGLIDAAAGIFFGDQQIAIWLAGQVLTEECQIEEMVEYADVIGVDRELYRTELLKVKRMPKKQFENICNFLFLNAKLLSQYALRNVSLTSELGNEIIEKTEIKELNKKLNAMVRMRTLELEGLNAELAETNAILEEEISERQRVEEEIRMLNKQLELKVKERTAELERTNAELIKREESIRLLLDSAADAIYGIDTDGNCTFCNVSCLKMLGYERKEDLLAKNMHWLIHYKLVDGTPLSIEECKIFRAFLKGEGTREDKEFFWRADGSCFPVEYSSHPQYHDGKIIGAVVTFRDITERKKNEAEIMYLSYHDQLTGLYNRRYFEQELKRLDSPENYPLTIVSADMNGLKLINDSFGHAVGDRILKKTAELFLKYRRAEDLVARIGGDEFIILMPRTSCYEAEQIIKYLRTMLGKERINSIEVSISFGCATKRNQEEEIQEILKKAEDNMYKIKLFESPSMRGKTIKTIISTLFEKEQREEAHARRVSELCQGFGKVLGLAQQDIDDLRTAGLLHDIGKIALDRSLLYKPGKLNEVEIEEIRRHPEIGYRILSSDNHLSDIAEYILSHHERWDGLGYPKGLKGEEIAFKSRIIAIADAYDAMTSERSYRKALTKTTAIEELKTNAGTQFDPELVEVFINHLM